MVTDRLDVAYAFFDVILVITGKSGKLRVDQLKTKVLNDRDEDNTKVEKRVMSNVQTLILPFFEKIKKEGLDKKQMAYANILESNLSDIISPFARRLTLKHLNFTPAEIQISNLIKQGRTSREIAELLNLSERTIESHRKNIRRKTGIKNKKENLTTHLLNI